MARALPVVLLVLCFVVAAATTPSCGQMLDLSAPEAPKPGEGRLTLDRAEVLFAEATEIAPDDTAGPRDRFSAELRRLAARILRLGETQGPDGSRLVVVGNTLADAVPSLEELQDRLSDAAVTVVVADVERLSRGLPKRADLVELRLREALAVLVRDQAIEEPAGWFLTDTPGDEVRLAELDARRIELADLGLSDAELTDLDALIAVWPTIDRWPTHRRDTLALARHILDAPVAGTGLPGLDAANRRRLAAVLSTPYTSTQADRLEALARERELIERSARFPRDDGGRRERQRLLLGMVEREPTADGLDVGRAIELLDAAERLDDLPNERALILPFRPVYRALLPTARASAARGRTAAVNLATRSGSVTDPATLVQARTLESADALFAELLGLNEQVGGEQGQPLVRYKALTDRVLAIGRSGLSGDVDGAADLLRRLLEDRALALRFEGLLEEVLPSVSDPARAETLVQRVSRARAAWTNAWSSPGAQGLSDDARREALALLRLLHLLADLDASTRNAAEHWPGWRLTPDAAATQSATFERLLDRALRRTFDRELETRALEQELSRIESETAALLLSGRLARLLPEPVPGASEVDRAAELLLGPPIAGAWLADHADALATACRYANELPHPRAPDFLRTYIASVALPIRERLTIERGKPSDR